MRKQLGLIASMLFLSATALIGVGCSEDRCCEPACYSQPCPQPCAPCPQPCPPVCAPCPQPCPPVCAPCPQPCAPRCEAPCAPVCPPARCEAPCAPKCEAPCAPACAPACAPTCEPVCKPIVKCCHPSSNELRCLDGITVTARNPRMCMLGEQYPLSFDVKA
jgi:hypothetical protein